MKLPLLSKLCLCAALTVFLASAGCGASRPAPAEASAEVPSQESYNAEPSPAAGPSSASSGVPSLDDDDEYLDSTGFDQVIADPLEPWNRFWFGFNDVVIEYVGRPVYKGYAFVTPSFMRQGVSNFFNNLAFPVRFVNCLLQGKGTEAGVEFSSFIMNTMAGVGFFDVASHYEKAAYPDDEDSGQTLGVWGMGEGVYLVWPLLGPSNVRDTLGMGMDYFMRPGTYLIDDFWVGAGVTAFSVINDFDKTLDAYDTMKGMAVEPYTAIRDGWTQFRRAKIAK